MQNELLDNLTAYLKDCGLNAVKAYGKRKFDPRETVICAALTKMSITASGLGNYIGLVSENGEVREMYGSSAALEIEMEVYSPTHSECESQKLRLLEALRECGFMKIGGMEFGGAAYDRASNMMKSRCVITAAALLVRELNGAELGEYAISEDAYE